jgi:hypothetical protein
MKMTIKQFLQKGISTRLSFGDKWMYYDNDTGYWEVREHKYKQRENKLLISTRNEEEAIAELIKGSEDSFIK